MVKDPVWKRVVGGLCGIGIMVAVLLLLRQPGVSGEGTHQWETAIVTYASLLAAAVAHGEGAQQWGTALVTGAAAANVVLWIVKRRQQRQP